MVNLRALKVRSLHVKTFQDLKKIGHNHMLITWIDISSKAIKQYAISNRFQFSWEI
jgi:hypothetical protein